MNQKTLTPFERYRLSLSSTDTAVLDTFMAGYDQRIFLHHSEKAQMRHDFECAIIAYESLGVSLPDALSRLAVENMGGFYARPSLRWFPLDNAAKIYPFSIAHGRMAVFRLSAYMAQPIVPGLLQMALTFTIKRFPSFATTVKKGFFWHYLDTAKRRYAVEQETSMPCMPLRVERSGSQSFRVLYYQSRVSMEFFHVLADGYGAMTFLKTLLAEYLRLLGVECGKDESTFDTNELPLPGELVNAFSLVPKTERSSGFVDKPAVQMSGRLTRQRPCRVLHFVMDTETLKTAAQRYHTTVSSYLLALMFIAGKHATDEAKGMFSVQVPVNMRKFYPSQTLRNFSMYCGIKLPLEAIADIEVIIPQIAAQLAQKASMQAMSEMVTATGRIVAALRFIPLLIKSPAVKLVNGILSDKIFSTTLSNLGIVRLLPPMQAHVLRMDAVLGPSISNRAGCAVVTLGNAATLSITKSTADPTFEETLHKLLLADAVTLRVEGSALYAD